MTTFTTALAHLLGFFLQPRDQRGLSQSTENAVLLAGAITVAGLVVFAVTAYVGGRLPK